MKRPARPDCYLFVIDTDSYAGNFHRLMCAYVTGQVGEYESGKEQARIAQREIPRIVAQFDELVLQVTGELGYDSPVSIFPNPRYENNNSVAIFFRSIPNSRLLNVMKKRARRIARRGFGLKGFESPVEIEGFRLLEKYTTYKELKL